MNFIAQNIGFDKITLLLGLACAVRAIYTSFYVFDNFGMEMAKYKGV